MNARGFENLVKMGFLFNKKIIPYVGKIHLDFGCGKGLGSFIIASRCPDSIITGYDIDKELIKSANKLVNKTSMPNLFFCDSLDEFDYGFSDPSTLEKIGFF